MEPGASPAHFPTTAVVDPLRVGTLALAWISPMPDSSHLRPVLHAFAQIFLQRHAGCGALVMLALASGAPALLVGALSGVLVAHLGATWLGYPQADRDDGLYGYNAALLGALPLPRLDLHLPPGPRGQDLPGAHQVAQPVQLVAGHLRQAHRHRHARGRLQLHRRVGHLRHDLGNVRPRAVVVESRTHPGGA